MQNFLSANNVRSVFRMGVGVQAVVSNGPICPGMFRPDECFRLSQRDLNFNLA